MEQRCKFLVKTGRSSQATPSTANRFSTPRPHHPSVALHTNEGRCLFCSANHLLSQCKGFKRLATDRRIETVKELRVSFNCLLSGHTAQTCTRGACHTCGTTHCYIPSQADQGPTEQWTKLRPLQPITPNYSQSLSCMASRATPPEYVFLFTAIVQVADGRGRMHECRALLDQGSQVNILKEEFAKRVGLKWESTQAVISGVGAIRSRNHIRGRTRITIAFRCSGYQCDLPCLIMPKLTTEIPNFKLHSSNECGTTPIGREATCPTKNAARVGARGSLRTDGHSERLRSILRSLPR